MSSQQFESVTHGKGVRTKTGPGISSNALIDTYKVNMDTEMGTCTVTTGVPYTFTDAVSGVSRAYLAGDVLFYSDGNTIWDSTDNVMFNAGIIGTGRTGGRRGLPQPVNFYKVPGSLTVLVSALKANALFWGFFNNGEHGIYTGQIDMTLNDGKGGFKNYENANQSTQCGSIAPATDMGALSDSCAGTSGCMTTNCMIDGAGNNIGVNIYSIGYDWSESPGNRWRGYYHAKLDGIITGVGGDAGFPNLTANPGTLTKVGMTPSDTQDAAIQMTIKVTTSDTSGLAKTAVIHRPGTGSPQVPDHDAVVEVCNVDTSTGVYSNAANKNIGQNDTGTPAGVVSPRWYAMDLEWSHTSSPTTALLYYPSLTISAGPSVLNMHWNFLDALNTWSVVPGTGFGSWEILDNANLPIWNGGAVQVGTRIIAGMWRDPQMTGRIFATTPEVIDLFSAAILESSPVWSTHYPEIYGTLSNPNAIQHYAIDTANMGTTALPSFWGTITPSGYFKYGAPAFTTCDYGASQGALYIGKCKDAAQFLVDTANNLWKMDTSFPVAGGIANQVASLVLNNFVDISANNYFGTVYIFDINAVSSLLQYQVYNERLGTTAPPVAVTNVVAAGWTDIQKIQYYNWFAGSGSNPSPISVGVCDKHFMMGLKAGSAVKFALGLIDTTLNTVSTYSAVSEIDIAADLGGVFAGKTLNGLASMRQADTATTLAYSYAAFGDRLAKFDHTANTWSALGGASGIGNFTSLYTDRSMGGVTPKLLATIGGIGANLVYDVNLTTGVLTLAGTGVISNDPGGFTWPAHTAAATTRNSADYFNYFPIKVVDTDPLFLGLGNICKDGDVWNWTDTAHVGCYKCIAYPDHMHRLANACGTLVIDVLIDSCRICPTSFNPSCETFLDCCNVGGIGPMILPGIISQNPGVLTPGNVYAVNVPVGDPVCGTLTVVEEEEPELWFSTISGKMYEINPFNGICTVPSWIAVNGTQTGLRDIAFDKHGNIVFTTDVSNISWASPWVGYESAPEILSNSYTSLECLDTDYTVNNNIVGAVMQFGVATFTTHTNVLGVITQTSNLTNVAISLGYDLSVDYNSGDYFVLGDQTGAGALNDVLVVDNATAASTFLADLDVLLTWVSGEQARGIERIRTSGPVSDNYILSMKTVGITHIEISLDRINDNFSLPLTATIPLINPTTGTVEWDILDEPNGLASKDLCSKWPNNVDPSTTPFADCATCVADADTVDCCYRLTECLNGQPIGVVIYSVQVLLDPYVGQIIRLNVVGVGDVCYLVERSSICPSPTTVTLAAAPGPYTDCTDCLVPATVYYMLPNCNNPADIVYTTDVMMPAVSLVNPPTVVQLQNECFCREVQINPLGPSGTEATYVIQNTIGSCSDCRFYIELINCIDGSSIYVDYNNSPTIVSNMPLGLAHNVTIDGVLQDDCYEIDDSCLGPTSTIYATGAATSTYNDCTDCANAGQVCHEVRWCCDPTVVTIVHETTGITAADIGLVVTADITILGILYTGCWSVTACAGPCCNLAIPDADVNTLASSTVGSGALQDCLNCVNSPCNDPCVLLKSCDVSNPDITVSGGVGASIGTDVVSLTGYPGCYYVCGSNLIHGTYWFWGAAMGMDWATGNVAALNLNGASNTTTAIASQTTNYTWRSSMVHCVETLVTFGATIYTPGDLMFYSDGKYVYDSTHTLMTDQTGVVLPAGTPLLAGGGGPGYLGTNSASQQCITVPAPAGGKTNGVYNQYYLFYQTIKNGPLYSAIIDMTLNGGLGQVLTASVDNIVSASSCEALTSTNTQAITEEWFIFDLPPMNACNDAANMHVRGYKIDAGGIGPAFVAVDMPASYHFWGSNGTATGDITMARCRIKVDYQNKQIGILAHSMGATPTSCTTGPAAEQHNISVWSLDMTTGTATGPGGQQGTNGYNGGLNNGRNSQILNIYSNWGAWMRDFEFSPSGEHLWTILGDQDIVGSGTCARLVRLNLIDSFQGGAANVNWNVYGSTQLCELPGQAPFSASAVGNGAHGWDMQLASDGKIYCVINQGSNAQSWTAASGNSATNDSLLVIEDPDMTTLPGPTYAALNLSAFNLGSRHIGTGLPTYLSAACPCDPLNIVPVTVSNTVLTCSDPWCSGPQTGAYKITECDCTGGSAFNSCSVNDPATMPANMATYGKSWSSTCWSPGGPNIPQRWPEIEAAVQALGTSSVPGIAQTITMTYSFLQANTIFTNIPWLVGSNFGPSAAVEQLVGATGSFSNTCLPYNKTYVQSHAQWQAEIASIFGEVKALLEGMFNTSCGYGADLTINFTDLGYESGPADMNSTMNPGNGVFFTDSGGVSNIGDFRIGLSDFGFLGNCPCTGGCSNGILGLCFNAPLTSAAIGLNKPTAVTGTLIFDVNENWRSEVMGQPLVPNSFSIKAIGVHEILHGFGYGHDFLSFGGVGPAGDCSVLCECPCYQQDNTCPGLNMCETFPGSGVFVPCCPGIMPNPDALMGPFANPTDFSTDFPTGLLGPEGIYDRRATCGIYGNPSLNWACEDGTCLAGCNFVTYYSNDPALAPFLNGIIIWDNGDPAGERCWEVEWVAPLPVGAVITPSIPFLSGTANVDCTFCGSGIGNDCYELNLCGCNTGSSAAPAQIVTDTDLSVYCNGTIGVGTTVEIDLWPGVCYQINCVPVPCGLAPTTVIVTASFADCTSCCGQNQTCYELCPCTNTPVACNCNQIAPSNLTLLSPTAFPGANFSIVEQAAFTFYTTFANGFTSTSLTGTPTYGVCWYSAIQMNPAFSCELVPGDGTEKYVYGNIMPYTYGTCTPNQFVGGPYNTWADIIADPVSVAAGAVITDDFPAWKAKMLIAGCPAGVVRGNNTCIGSVVPVPITNSCGTSLGTFNHAFSGAEPTALNFISTPANGLLSTVFNNLTVSYQYNAPGVFPPPACYDATGNIAQRYITSITLSDGVPPVPAPWPGMVNTFWNRWDLFLAEMVAAGYANVGDTYVNIKANAAYLAQSTLMGATISAGGGPCNCSGPAVAPCVTVTNDLSGNLGDIVQVGPGPPPGLIENECYIVDECGLCTTDPTLPCTPVGPVTIVGPFGSCVDCANGTGCDCYLLRECDDISITINNVCTSVDLDNAFLNNDIIKINGGNTCYTVECDSPTICNPGTCITVAVTGSGFNSCQACNGGQAVNYECDFPGSCTCIQSAGPAFASCPQALADQDVNGSGQPCCPSIIEYECEPINCNCVPCLVPPCPGYNANVSSAANLAACMADTSGCCNTNNSVTYDCVYDSSVPSYGCIDPGNGMGSFTGATALADCNAAVASNTQPCYVPTYKCTPITGACYDPGDGSGPFNDSNGGLAACISCAGCALDPSCVGTNVQWDCDPVYGCIQNWFQTGTYANINDCVQFCASQDPDPGTFEGDCTNCLEEIDMKDLFEKVSDMCEECNVPYGLTEQETHCEPDCFTGNVYMFIDTTSVFFATNSYATKLQQIANFKTNVLVPAFNRIKLNNPSYQGHLYILLGAWPFGTFGNCNDCNNTGAVAPGAGANLPESWLQWVQYPLSGNAGANGGGPNPMASGTLPANKRVVLANTMVDGVGGLPWVCNGGAYDPAAHQSLLEQIMILPGSYVSDGFTQVNPWADPVGKEGMTDPYHEFEGGDRDSKVILITDEASSGYHQFLGGVGFPNAFTNPQGTCGAPLINGVPATNWNGYGLGAGNLLTSEWKNDYTNYMSLHQFGWDSFGFPNVLPQSISQRAFVLAVSTPAVGPPAMTHSSRWSFQYHLYQAIGGDAGTVSAQGHISCAQYRPIPAVYGIQAYAITDPTIPNMYMGASGGGDATLVTGYKGGSLSNYGINFHIPNNNLATLTEEEVYRLMVEYLTDC